MLPSVTLQSTYTNILYSSYVTNYIEGTLNHDGIRAFVAVIIGSCNVEGLYQQTSSSTKKQIGNRWIDLHAGGLSDDDVYMMR